MTLATVVTFPVPHFAFGELLLGGKHGATTPRTTLTLRGLDAGRIWRSKWTTIRNLLLSEMCIILAKSILGFKVNKIAYVKPSVCKNPEPQANP